MDDTEEVEHAFYTSEKLQSTQYDETSYPEVVDDQRPVAHNQSTYTMPAKVKSLPSRMIEGGLLQLAASAEKTADLIEEPAPCKAFALFECFQVKSDNMRIMKVNEYKRDYIRRIREKRDNCIAKGDSECTEEK